MIKVRVSQIDKRRPLNFYQLSLIPVYMDIDRFISLRKSLGYTQKTFAACLGIPNTTADIERGKTKLSGKIVVELIKQFTFR